MASRREAIYLAAENFRERALTKNGAFFIYHPSANLN
jgi:hypothetical protein